MVDMPLSGENPAAIEAVKKVLGIGSVNAHLFAAQKAAERQAERDARDDPRMNYWQARHFSKRPVY
jgi:hypothetical protein